MTRWHRVCREHQNYKLSRGMSEVRRVPPWKGLPRHLKVGLEQKHSNMNLSLWLNKVTIELNWIWTEFGRHSLSSLATKLSSIHVSIGGHLFWILHDKTLPEANLAWLFQMAPEVKRHVQFLSDRLQWQLKITGKMWRTISFSLFLAYTCP